MKFTFILYFLFLFNSFRFTPDKQQIDKRLKNSEMLLYQEKSKEYLDINIQIAQDAKRISYSKGIAIANFRIGMALNMRGDFDQSIQHLVIAEHEEYTQNSEHLKADINRVYGDNENKLGLYNIAIEREKRILNSKIGSKDILYSIACNKIGEDFLSLNRFDSAYFYHKKAYISLLNSDSTEQIIALSIVCGNLSSDWGRQNKPDSARFYLFKSLKLAEQTKYPYTLQVATKKAGSFFLTQKKYDSALVYFHRSLQLVGKSNYMYEFKSLYKSLYETYSLNHNESKSVYYLKLYTAISDSITTLEKKGIPIAISDMDNDHEKFFTKNKDRLLQILVIITFSLIMISGVAYYHRFKMFKKEKHKRVIDKKEFLDSLAEVKSQAEIDAFSMLVELAKKRDPAFFIKFNELSPNFRCRLLAKFPDLSVNDFEFCAYLKMNFDTKEIARYANMTVRSVEARKYRIRKKFGISSYEDINMWIANI